MIENFKLDYIIENYCKNCPHYPEKYTKKGKDRCLHCESAFYRNLSDTNITNFQLYQLRLILKKFLKQTTLKELSICVDTEK